MKVIFNFFKSNLILALFLFFSSNYSYGVERDALNPSPTSENILPDKPQFDESLIQYNQQEESKVPVLVKKEDRVEAQSAPLYQTVVSVFFIFLVGATGIWYLKKKAVGINHSSSLMQIKMITQFHLGPKKSIAVVRVAGESLLLGITDQNIGLIKALSLLEEDIPDQTPKNFSIPRDQSNTPPANTIVKYAGTSADKDEEFSFASLKNIVDSRLKNIRKW